MNTLYEYELKELINDCLKIVSTDAKYFLHLRSKTERIYVQYIDGYFYFPAVDLEMRKKGWTFSGKFGKPSDLVSRSINNSCKAEVWWSDQQLTKENYLQCLSKKGYT